MAITLRSSREIELMRQAGAIVADVLSKLKEIAKPGIFDTSCKISFRPEQVDRLNRWLMEAKSKALELRDSTMNMVNEGGPA